MNRKKILVGEPILYYIIMTDTQYYAFANTYNTVQDRD